ncbi:MAG: G protein-coupled receptor LGR4 [Verrucomicrobiaceae bacterium]|nr:G protein-coupled receptor LGR4 [Verrucomicrobiaceae bacterium]
MKLPLTIILCLASSAFALDPHVEAVTRIVEGAKGKVEKTEDGQSLKLVDLAVPNTGPHDHRKNDPYDAAFFEHLGHISTLESLNVISTKFNDEWMPHIAKLTNLKTLRFTNNGPLTDAGMEQLAGLKNLEAFSFVGTKITGKAYAKFDGFTKLVKVSHRGSSINDEGLKELCDHLPNLESISLAHAKFTDAGAPHLAKLTKLKGFEIGTSNATPQALVHLAKLPLESLQLGEGFASVDCIPLIKCITTLRRLTLTEASKLTDAELKVVAGLTQLEHLELGKVPFPDARLSVLADFAFLKSMRLAPGKEPYSDETQAKIKALLPKTALTFK